MNDIAIQVKNLSKLYHIGRAQERHDTLRDALVDGFRKPIERLSRRRSSSADQQQSEDTIWALKDVSFEVRQGEVLGIIGRNGAGKSTLLKILSRITEPTQGRVEMNGRVGSLLEVGTGFHHELTGRENIYLSGAILGMRKSEIDRRFDEIVAFSEIEKFLDTPVKRYSSGMYVRLAFAVAAHLEPEILLIDEVLAVGDAQFQKKCLGKMDDVAKEGRTVLFVSHNIISLRSLCPRSIWIDRGTVKEDGPSSDVITDYLTLQSTNISERIWDEPDSAPGNSSVRIRRVWVETENGSSIGGLAREAPVYIGIEYWNLDPTAQLHVTLRVSVEQQVIAFSARSFESPAWPEIARRQGLIQSICKIPANFLNTGQYRVKVMIVKNGNNVIYVLDDALVFEMIETEARSGSWFGKEPGVVRPTIPWEIKHLGY